MKKPQPSRSLNGSVMVVGGGIAGMQAALDLADSGFYVHLVEKSPAIGMYGLRRMRNGFYRPKSSSQRSQWKIVG
jgi:heterodisulfide reductase subunit A